VAWNEPVAAPAGECLAHTEIWRRIAARMGLEEPLLYDDDETLARQLFDTADPTLAGITPERLRADGWARLRYDQPFVPFADGFPTPSGRLELFSERAARDGHDPLPTYTPPVEVADAGVVGPGRLALIAGASHWFLNSMFANAPGQIARAGAPVVLLHPDDAAERGLREGDRIRIHNARGSFEAVAGVSDATRRGVAAASKGHWPKLLPGRANVNATVEERDTDMGGGPVFHDNAVAIERLPTVRLRAPHKPREARFLEYSYTGSWALKVYGIAASGEGPRAALVRSGVQAALGALPDPAATPGVHGLGFVVVHDAADFGFVLVDWWAGENELHQRLFSADLDDPSALRPHPTDAIACVWELGVLDFERRAWLEHVLANPSGPDVDAYVDATYEDRY
jgi:formylmethanofuran dehydrogenase subunit D